MECFIKRIIEKKVDEQAHRQFVRYGKGEYTGKAALNVAKGEKLKFKGSYEYANDFVLLASEFNAKFSGIVMSREKLDLGNSKLKSGIYIYNIENLDSSKIREIFDKIYFMLLDAQANNFDMKMKKKLPKPGKSGESKIDDNFCVIESSLVYWPKIKEAFLWDVPDFKKCKIRHSYEIKDLKMPQGEKDFNKIRLMTKRIGKLKRIIEINGETQTKEFEFEA